MTTVAEPTAEELAEAFDVAGSMLRGASAGAVTPAMREVLATLSGAARLAHAWARAGATSGEIQRRFYISRATGEELKRP